MLIDNVEVSIGKAVGHIFEDLLISAKKRLWVISPWIAPEYAELAVKKKRDGVDVQIVTTDHPINNAAIKKLLETKVEVTEGKILGFIPTRKERTYHISKIGEDNLIVQYQSARFTHAKIYIVDDIGVIGSVNLTWKGLWYNIEVLVVIKDKKAVEKLIEKFHNIKEHPLMKKRGIEELANYLLVQEKVQPPSKVQPSPKIVSEFQEKFEKVGKEISEKIKRYLEA
ncbi:Cardiolipin synthase A [subsurface metagenome]|nr:hypothetical protein [Hadesarchaea archaeon]